ncbi:MAG: phosphate ABC transporter substrate-binding protein PstS [Novosphingobium sp.]|nr:phosphate ABC transporter substrate-binding protein PstS [Novosphingobium sp.]
MLSLVGVCAIAACSPGSNNTAPGSANANAITGAGSTFVYPVLSKWSADYASANGVSVNYQSIGSGGGIAQIKAATVDFGATDKPLAPDELASSGLAQFPLVIGGVVPVVHIAGVGPGQLRFSGSLLADIYLGKVKTWNDPAIASLNPGAKLQAAPITVVHRSDGSGTTFNWVHYLGQVSPEWKGKIGEGTSVSWPTGVGGKGNEGVAAYVNQIPNAIGYVEFAYAMQNKMSFGQVQNAAGQFVAPSAASFQSAAAGADWAHAKDFYLVMTNAAGAASYPITATTFVLMYRHPKDAQRSAAALKFFRWALTKGQPQAQALNYVPLPPTLASQVDQYLTATIK